jgi:LDH2 family malate/lactate/ureidoglycolate dehydrogenase
MTAERMRALTAGIFAKIGMSEQDAGFMGDCLVDADLRGVLTHGCRFVPMYFKWFNDGIADPKPNVTVVSEASGTMAYDAGDSLGHVVSAKAMQECIDRAKELGIAAATVRNSRHCGAMAYYAQMAADQGCIGYAVTNGGVAMVPFGGRDRAVGLNPMAWAAPTDRPWSVNLDMATSVVAGSKVMLAIEKGEKIPLGWAVDEAGAPTEDPHAAMKGAMLPLGGPKGYGLAIILDILSGVLSGGRFGVNQGLDKFSKKEQQYSHFYMAISIEKFMPVEEFKQRMGELIDTLKQGRLAEGSSGVFLPGEIEYNTRQRFEKEGIPYPAPVIEEIEKIALELGVA